MYESANAPAGSAEPEPTPAAPKPRKRKKRIFLWSFLVVQAIFLAWLITGLATKTGPSAAQVASLCGKHAWYPLWKSYSDCAAHSGLTAAGDIGKGIAVGLIIGLWVAVDVILGVGRLVVVFARGRGSHA